MRLRSSALLVLATAVVLAGCSDPSPETPTAEQTSSSPSPTSDAPSDPTSEPSSSETGVSTGPPVFGTATSSGGGGSVCLDEGEPLEATLSTALTAGGPITLEAVTLTPQPPEVVTLDEYVLPFAAGAAGLTFGDYPPDDPEGARSDAAGYELGEGETVIVGIGFSIPESAVAAPMTLGVTYTDAADRSQTLESSYDLVLAEDCDAGF